VNKNILGLGLVLFSSYFGVTQEAQAADESVTVIARIFVTPGREAEAEARYQRMIEFVRKAEPNVVYRFFRSKKDPSLFMTYEVYPNQAAASDHLKVTLPSFAKEIGPTPEGLLSRPMEIEVLRALSD
jgi:quinol monooxygenase YgiN